MGGAAGCEVVVGERVIPVEVVGAEDLVEPSVVSSPFLSRHPGSRGRSSERRGNRPGGHRR